MSPSTNCGHCHILYSFLPTAMVFSSTCTTHMDWKLLLLAVKEVTQFLLWNLIRTTVSRFILWVLHLTFAWSFKAFFPVHIVIFYVDIIFLATLLKFSWFNWESNFTWYDRVLWFFSLPKTKTLVVYASHECCMACCCALVLRNEYYNHSVAVINKEGYLCSYLKLVRVV